jgi:hypothetical protein
LRLEAREHMVAHYFASVWGYREGYPRKWLQIFYIKIKHINDRCDSAPGHQALFA